MFLNLEKLHLRRIRGVRPQAETVIGGQDIICRTAQLQRQYVDARLQWPTCGRCTTLTLEI